MFKDELRGKIMKKLCTPRAKTYAFLLDDDTEKKKAKGTKKCIIKRILKLEDYKESVFKNKIMLMSQQRFKSDRQNISTEEINKVAISSNNDKRIQTFDGITTYLYGTNAFMVCKSKMLVKRKDMPIMMYYQQL